uniref:YTH domain-containing family protein n=1 Tax=Kalanchoe fedtschenkoi TaxID=63787 RepID=A0A7N0ULK7_KALFE
MAAAAAASADHTADLLEKMTLETENKASQKSDDATKSLDKKFGPMLKGNLANGHVPKYERSSTPTQLDYMSYPYFYGAYDGTTQDRGEFMRYFYAEGAEVPAGVYGDNGPLMYHPYAYAPYAPYSPAVSPGPAIEGQSHGSQQYQYHASYPSITTSTAPFTPPTMEQKGVNVVKDQKPKPLSAEAVNGGDVKVNSGVVPAKPLYSNPAFSVTGPLGNGPGAFPGGFPSSGYQDTRFGFDASRFPARSDGPISGSTVNSSIASGNTAFRNQNMRPQQNHPMARLMTRTGQDNGFMSRMFTNPVPFGYGYMSNGYDARINGRGWLSMDSKYKPRGRGNGFYGYGNENAHGLNELNRGPRAKVRSLNTSTPIESVIKNQAGPASPVTAEEKNKLIGSPVAEDYNLTDFPVDYADAKFFIIKSYSEDDVHKSVKYNVWASTPNGNKKLDSAYKLAQEMPKPCPIFLFFSVNASGQFVGLAEMVSSVDFDKNLEYWQQDKWNGCFSLKWHIVKDVPNVLLKHIILENNENKPVTNSRDTQEVKLEQGLQMLKIFKDHSCRTSILDDFGFYEARQKAIQEKKVRMQFQKQVWEGKASDAKSHDGKPALLEAVSKLTDGPIPAALANGDAKIVENGSIAKASGVPVVF